MPLNSSLGMGFLFTAQNLASGTFRQLQRDFTQMERATAAGAARIDKAMKQIKAGFLLAGAGAVGLGISLSLAGAAGKFEQGLAGVGAITGATTDELRKLEQAAIDAGIKTQFSPTEAIEGLTALGQAGLNSRESIQTLQPALDLAAGSLGQLSVQESAGLAVQGMKAFGVETENVGFAVDQMLKTTNKFNISARELPLAFGIGARGAQALNASLGDTAIALGLAKNVMPSVERASTSVAVAMERLARKQGQQKLATEFGVQAIDKSTGKFRGFLDIVGDMIGRTAKMTEAQKSNALAQVFGARAAGGISAIITQLSNGIKDANGNMLKGAEAIAYLRNEMDTAGGTAAKFREALLDTFEGQKTLLRGTLQTAAVVFGKPFAKVFKPVVTIVTNAINALIKAWQGLSDQTKGVIAKFVVFASSGALITGIVLLVKGALTLLGVTIGGIAATVGSALISILPFALAIAAVIGAVKLFYEAVRRNVGGIEDFFKRAYDKVAIFFRAMSQLFSEGGFSGAVLEDLNRAENRGLKAFVVRAFVVLNRFLAFWDGLKTGVGSAVDAMAPAINGLIAAFYRLGGALGFMATGPGSPKENARQFDMWVEVGLRVGETIGWLVDLLVRGLSFAIDTVTATVKSLRGEVADVGPVAQRLGNTFATSFKIVSAVVGSAWVVVKTIFRGWSLLFQAFGGTLVDWGDTWIGVKMIIFDVIAGIIDVVFLMTRQIARALDSVASLIGKDLGAEAAVNKITMGMKRGVAKAFGPEVAREFETTTPTRAARPEVTRRLAAAAIQPGASVAETAVVTRRLEAAQQAGFTDEQMEKLARKIAAEQRPVILEIDGEKIAETSSNARRAAAGRSFAPVPTT